MSSGSTEVTIEQKDFVTVQSSNRIAVFVQNIQLFTSADIHVHYLNENGDCIDYNVLKMEGDDYAAWGNDDQYVINWVLSQIRVTYRKV
jgi:hypothetical protein